MVVGAVLLVNLQINVNRKMSNSLTCDSSLIQRLLAWMKQRFPLSDIPLFVSLYLCTAIVTRYVITEGKIVLNVLDLVACVVTCSFFLLLRIFDEYMDYETDLKARPEYLLQSGLIELKHLKVIGFLVIGLQVGYSFFLDRGLGSVTVAWFAMFSWSWLASHNFYCGKWFNEHLVQYAIVHYSVMPLNLWWLAQMANPKVLFSPNIQLLALLSFVSALAFEFVRKTHPPQEEREGLDTYSSIFGPRIAGFLSLILVLGTLVIQAYLVSSIASSFNWLGYLEFGICLLFSTWQILKFCYSPSIQGRKMNRMAVGLCIIAGHFVIACAVLLERGLAWQLL
jgi:4-hydroxybenzoate polyprenyltransferase